MVDQVQMTKTRHRIGGNCCLVVAIRRQNSVVVQADFDCCAGRIRCHRIVVFVVIGLRRQTNDASPLLVSGDGGWWGIGIFAANGLRGSTLPGPKENFTRKVELWVERSQESSTMTVDEHGNMEHTRRFRWRCQSATATPLMTQAIIVLQQRYLEVFLAVT